MPTTDDLIVKALHDRAATVTPASLQYPDFASDRPTRQPPSTRDRMRRPALLAAAAGVVAVLAVVFGIAALRPHSHQHNAATGGDSTALAGPRWQITGVRSAGNSYPVPASYRAELQFTQNGDVSGLDGINALHGTYRVSADKISIVITEGGAAGGTGTFPALEAMASTYVPRSLNTDAVTSTYTLSPHTLVLDTGHWAVTFTAYNAGATTPNAPAAPTSTT